MMCVRGKSLMRRLKKYDNTTLSYLNYMQQALRCECERCVAATARWTTAASGYTTSSGVAVPQGWDFRPTMIQAAVPQPTMGAAVKTTIRKTPAALTRPTYGPLRQQQPTTTFGWPTTTAFQFPPPIRAGDQGGVPPPPQLLPPTVVLPPTPSPPTAAKRTTTSVVDRHVQVSAAAGDPPHYQIPYAMRQRTIRSLRRALSIVIERVLDRLGVFAAPIPGVGEDVPGNRVPLTYEGPPGAAPVPIISPPTTTAEWVAVCAEPRDELLSPPSMSTSRLTSGGSSNSPPSDEPAVASHQQPARPLPSVSDDAGSSGRTKFVPQESAALPAPLFSESSVFQSIPWGGTLSSPVRRKMT